MGWPIALAAAGSVASHLSNRRARKSAEQQAAANNALQMDLARNGLKYRVQDAKEAGLHPLAALGFQAPTIQPATVAFNGSSPLGEFAQTMGQDMFRAQYATATAKERGLAFYEKARNEAFLERRMALDIQGKELENAYFAARIRQLESQPSPPFPEYQAEQIPVAEGVTKAVAPEIKSAMKGVPSVEAGNNPGMRRYRIGGPNLGYTTELPAGDNMADALESQGSIVSNLTTALHATLRWLDKKFYGSGRPKDGPDYTWEWSVLKQAWVPKSKKRK